MRQLKSMAGFSLLEVLISVVILSVGLLALAGFNGNLYKSVRYSNDRAKAMASAQVLIDKARSEDLSALTSGTDPGSCADSTPHRTWTVSSVGTLSNAKNLAIYVCWTDANSTKQEMSIATQVGVTSVAAAATPAPTAGSTPAPTAASCTTPAYVAGTAYSNGAKAKYLGRHYSCKVSGWCSSGAAAAWYAPGQGTNWQDAWTDLGECV
ncbi:prepilin-type N-terminal cleavage/methylation domain-containing protein [Chitinibacter fontanus]|uniref:Prepilin-type N-terminal cleavage/methylation domain-containing protein n=1 Tax=Chitinibacter fontanus TaxID=1737446 RepID=A0A7D5ZCV7_9NEIS|nr:prepilin-type N-terminal cleavage/methylation domain-containing protein [Chitinibacter fontanus]QLI80188.1 prepilin-type N-terminal cleavage/methylation domain-containing protein [Chitinibacter fontanus]